MKIYRTYFLIMSVGFIEKMVSAGLPTREEQANLLRDVQEIFEQLKFLVNIETNSTDESVLSDINKMIQRATGKLELLRELCLIKISCGSNSVCTLQYKQKLVDLSDKGCEDLKICTKQCTDAVKTNSFALKNSTECAIQTGENLLGTLYNCSRKSGFQVISCYKDVIAKDVSPVKKIFLVAIEAHKEGHLKTVQIRNLANKCVDDVLERYETKIMKLLNEALHCT